MTHPLEALSPLDGRYEEKVEELRGYFSEFALFGYRLHIEVEWLIFLCNTVMLKGTKKLLPAEIEALRDLVRNFDGVSAERIKDFEKQTKHDVKALEYFIRENTSVTPTLKKMQSFIHFAATSEDINNCALALSVRDASQGVFMPLLTGVIMDIHKLAIRTRDVAMMGRTHGQPASPTTIGKEFINFVARLEDQFEMLMVLPFRGKFNGATGNFNAHLSAYPKIDWTVVSTKFVQSIGLTPNLYSTQIQPYDSLVARFDAMRRINSILIDLCRDTWTYISLGFFTLKKTKGQVGSSTMPHKVNPIDFENAEGNLGLANALFTHFAEKLPVSRLQRDLSDSTVARNIGVAFGHSVLAYRSLLQGLSKLECNKTAVAADLKNEWPLLAEPIQTVLRANGDAEAYEKLKTLTQGKNVDQKIIRAFIKKLPMPAAERARLLKLTPTTYTGLAQKLVDDYKPRFKA